MKVSSRIFPGAADAAVEVEHPLEGAAQALRRAATWLGADAPRIPSVDWNAMMRRYGHRVVVSLVARGVAPERAKELAQDAWLRVIQSHRAGRLPELRLPGVVVTQAQYLALDEHRRSEHRYSYDSLSDEADAEPLPDDRHLEHQIAARQQLRHVQAVVARAHPNAQRVFALLYGGSGLSASEIAEQLGLSVQRVRQIACELRQKIRRELEIHPGGSGA